MLCLQDWTIVCFFVCVCCGFFLSLTHTFFFFSSNEANREGFIYEIQSKMMPYESKKSLWAKIKDSHKTPWKIMIFCLLMQIWQNQRIKMQQYCYPSPRTHTAFWFQSECLKKTVKIELASSNHFNINIFRCLKLLLLAPCMFIPRIKSLGHEKKLLFLGPDKNPWTSTMFISFLGLFK